MDHLLSKEQPRRNAAAMVERPSGRGGAETRRHPDGSEQAEDSPAPPPGRKTRPDRKAPEHASRETSRAGGIAQLVERQLCKLDAAGSNPAASTNVLGASS